MTMIKQNATYLTYEYTTFILMLTNFNFFPFTFVLNCKK